MIRFVKDPDGNLVPDIAENLPGRGVWVQSDQKNLQAAIKNGGFKRGLKSDVKIPDDIELLTVRLLKMKLLSLMTMALKGSQAFIGFDQVRSAAQAERLSWRIEALDGSEGGRSKIRVLTKAVGHELGQPQTPVIGCFTSAELGRAFGRETIVHGAIKSGHMNVSFGRAAFRLAGFCDLIPENWPDRSHEIEKFNAQITGDKG